MKPFQKIIVIVAIALLMYFFISRMVTVVEIPQGQPIPETIEIKKESFYDWQTLGVDPSKHHESKVAHGIRYKNPSYPHYLHLPEHQMFLDPKCVGEGSCIYNKNPPSDCVLPDWQCIKDCFPKWSDPPLDSDIFDFQKRYGYTPNTDGCLCRNF